MSGGLGLTFPSEKGNRKYSLWQVTAISPCCPSVSVLNEVPMFLWTGSLPDPMRTAQSGIYFKSANDIKAAVTYCLSSNTSSVLQQLSSSPLPLITSGLCSGNPTDRNGRGLPGISHLFPKHNESLFECLNKQKFCRQESRRYGGAMQWGP